MHKLLLIVFWMCTVSGSMRQPLHTFHVTSTNKTFALYKDHLIWQQAFDACRAMGQSLAAIPDSGTQRVMEHIAKKEHYPDFDDFPQAWVGGTRSSDSTWRDVNGQEFNYDGWIADGGSADRTKLLLNLEPGLDQYDKLHIAEFGSYWHKYRALCEYEPPSEGCLSNTVTTYFPLSNKCLTVSLVVTGSWDVARAFCLSSGWELAHTGLGSWEYYNQLLTADIQMIKNESAVWIGIFRRPWVWLTATGDQKYVIGTHWIAHTSLREDCMFIYLNERGMWQDKWCELHSEYFVCESPGHLIEPGIGPKTLMASSIMAMTQNQQRSVKPEWSTEPASTLRSTTDQSKYNTNPDAQERNERNVKLYAIIGAIGAALLITNSIIAAICITRKKMKKKRAGLRRHVSSEVYQLDAPDQTPDNSNDHSIYEAPPDVDAILSPMSSPDGSSDCRTGIILSPPLLTTGTGSLPHTAIISSNNTAPPHSLDVTPVPAHGQTHDYTALVDEQTRVKTVDEQTRVKTVDEQTRVKTVDEQTRVKTVDEQTRVKTVV